jgi:hypothetical protein
MAGITVVGGYGGVGGSGAAVLIDSAGPVISNCYFANGVVRPFQGNLAGLHLPFHVGDRTLHPSRSHSPPNQEPS